MKLLKPLFAFVLLLLAACGSSTSYDYRIGIDASWFPLSIPGREKNVLGFSKELLKEIGRARKIEIATVSMNWDNLFLGLKEAEYEAILSSMPPYQFNRSKYDFSDLYIQTGPVLVMPMGSDVKSLEQLAGKEIAVQRDSESLLILEKYPEILIRVYDSVPQALNDILAEVVDGAVVDVLSAYAYCQDLYAGKLKVATEPLNQEGLRLLALHDAYPMLIEDFNKGLAELKKNGRYAELLIKWSLPQ